MADISYLFLDFITKLISNDNKELMKHLEILNFGNSLTVMSCRQSS